MNTLSLNTFSREKSKISGINRRIMIFCQDRDYERALKLLIESSSLYFTRMIDPELNLVDNIQMLDPGIFLYEFDGDIQFFVNFKRGIAELRRQPKLLIIIKEEHLSFTSKLLEVGIDAMMIRGMELHKMRDVLKTLEGNDHYLAQKIVNHLVTNMAKNDNADLTEREHQILMLLGQGLSYAAIGNSINIGLETVKTHVKNLYVKLNVNSKADALEISRKQKLI